MARAMTAVAPATRTGVRYHYLDGIRGLSAMYVLLFHSLTISVPQEDQALSPVMRSIRSIFGYGHFAVAVFIVLSGFSLMLPLARAHTTELRNGFGHYMYRRCRRVMPPYYAALALSIAAILASSVVLGETSESADEALSRGSVISHLFLVHNLNSDWVYRINGPMWSVATEFQIYLLFPLVLLPLWRRIGPVATVVAAWGAAYVLHFSLPDDANFSWAAPWFVGSFAAGMWGAMWAMDRAEDGGDETPWGKISLGFLGVLVLILAAGGGSWPLPILDAIVTAFAVAWVLACMARNTNGVDSLMNRTLGAPSMVMLGAFSYSLYLLQHPFLRLTEALLGRTDASFEVILWIQLLVGTPIIMLASWFFAEIFEMPFTTGGTIWPRIKRALGPENAR